MAAYPPAPWHLAGELTLIPALVRTRDARRFPVPHGARLRQAAGRTLGGVLLADYRGAPAYRELIVFSALVTVGSRPGLVVSHIYVDSEASLRGGREIWGLPKELARFEAAGATLTVRQGDRVLLAATGHRRARGLPLAFPAPAVGELKGRAVLALGRARVTAAPARVRLEIPPESPFAPLRLDGVRAALAGNGLTLKMPSPN